MSPTATIAAVVAALILVALIVQTETKVPGLDEYNKQQAEKAKGQSSGAAPGPGVVISDPNVVRNESAVLVSERNRGGGPGTESNGVITTEVDPDLASEERPGRDDGNNHVRFKNNIRLNGTFVSVLQIGDEPVLRGDESRITFNSDGTFTSQNMSQADVDMEAGTTAMGPRDVSSGRYRISRTTLTLDYNDGLKRRKGDHRVFTMLPVEGTNEEPTAITIQGHVFKRVK